MRPSATLRFPTGALIISDCRSHRITPPVALPRSRHALATADPARGSRGLGIILLILGLVHTPLPQPDFHNPPPRPRARSGAPRPPAPLAPARRAAATWPCCTGTGSSPHGSVRRRRSSRPVQPFTHMPADWQVSTWETAPRVRRNDLRVVASPRPAPGPLVTSLEVHHADRVRADAGPTAPGLRRYLSPQALASPRSCAAGPAEPIGSSPARHGLLRRSPIRPPPCRPRVGVSIRRSRPSNRPPPSVLFPFRRDASRVAPLSIIDSVAESK